MVKSLKRGFISLGIGIGFLSLGVSLFVRGLDPIANGHPKAFWSVENVSEAQRTALLGLADNAFLITFVSALLIGLGIAFLAAGFMVTIRVQMIDKIDRVERVIRVVEKAALCLALLLGLAAAAIAYAIAPSDAPISDVAGVPFTATDRELVLSWIGDFWACGMLLGFAVAFIGFAAPAIAYRRCRCA